MEGEAPGLFGGYATQGIIQKDDITDQGVRYIKKDGTEGYYKTFNSKNPVPGGVKFVEMNDDGVINAKDRTLIGNPKPDFTYGFQTRISRKDLSLKVAFQNMWSEDNPSNLFPSSTFEVDNYAVG